MSDTATDLELTLTRQLPFPPERVFDAWLDPKMMARFMLPCEGGLVPEAMSEARVGGQFRVVMQPPGTDGIPHSGTYRVIDRPKRIEFTWVSPYSVDGSVVTLDFAPKDGGCELTLRHVRFSSEQSRDGHSAGWTTILDQLPGVLAA